MGYTGGMSKTPLSIRYDVELIAMVDEQAGWINPPPSRGWMVNHLLWRAVRETRNIDRAAERLHRLKGPRSDGPWKNLSEDRKDIYRDIINQLVEDMASD